MTGHRMEKYLIEIPSMCVVFGGLPGLLPTLKPVQLPCLVRAGLIWLDYLLLFMVLESTAHCHVGLGCLGGGSGIEQNGLDKMWINQLGVKFRYVPSRSIHVRLE